MNANCISSPAKIERWRLKLIQGAFLATLFLAPRFLLAQTNCTPRLVGLVAWWPGDGFALDVASTNHGTLKNGATYASGKVGPAFFFDGVDDYATAGHPSALQSIVNAITIEAWIKVGQFNKFCQAIVTKGDSAWRLQRAGNTTDIDFGTTGLSNVDLNGSRDVGDGQWHHVAAVYDGSRKFIYVDGTLDASTPATGSISMNTFDVLIGENAEVTGRYWNGLIDEVAIYNRALSSAEIAGLYSAGSAGKCFTNVPVPVFVQQPVGSAGYLGAPFTLTAAAMGTPRPSFQWFKDSQRIAQATNPVLSFANLHQTNQGSYRCVASNSFGAVTSQVAGISLARPDYLRSAKELYAAGFTADAAYVIDPDGPGGQPPMAVFCLMSLSGGGWIKLTPSIAASALNTNQLAYREFLYAQNGTVRWYRTPQSRLIWSWASGKDLTGIYYYGTEVAEGAFVVTPSDEHQSYGVGGSSGGGGSPKCLVIYPECLDPVNGQVQLCQDVPGIFCGSCCCDVTVYIRELEGTAAPSHFNNPESFESGWGDWSTDGDLWQVRKPENGPITAYNGVRAACGNTGSDYEAGTTCRLISPAFSVPVAEPGAVLALRFWQWYQYGSGDAGLVQVSRWDGSVWGNWTTAMIAATNGTSIKWQQIFVDLSPWQGQEVRVAFQHTANADGSVGAGWYLDQLELSSFIPTPVNLGAPVSGRFTANDQPQFFVVEVPPGGHLRLTLRDLDMLGVNELYLRRGALPSPGSYDYRFNINGAADQTILAPDAGAGKWYILAYNASGPIPGDFTLQADCFTGVALESVSPSVLGNSGPGTLDIRGAGFTPSAVVSLVKGGTSYLPTETSVVSGGQMLADFNFPALPAGAYSLRVTSGTNSSELPFTVTSGGQPGVTTKIILPRQVGYHMPATIYVEYSNTGQVATLAPILEVSAQQNGRRAAILTLDETRLVEGFWTAAMPEGFANSVQFLASGKTPGILQPGESGRVPIYYAGWQQPWDFGYPMIYWNLSVLAQDSTNQIDWLALKDSMRPSTLATNQWEPVFFNLIAQVGLTWGDYVRALDNNARYLAKVGVNVTDIRDLLSFEVMQASGLSVTRTLASALDAQVQAPGLPITFTRSFSTDIPSHFRLGRFGRGWSDNWDYALTNAPDGTVTILGPSGSRRVFQPDSRDLSHYFAQPGDTATLTSQGGGAFTLQESSGTRYAYSAGKLQYIQDTHTNRITCTYTGDQLTRLTHSAGPWLQIAYTGARVAAMVDSVGRQTTFGYDGAAEHLASVTDYRGLATTYQYQSLLTSAATHALTDIGKPDGTHQFYTYDGQGRLASKSGCCGTGGTTTYAYDSAGKVTATDCLTNVSTYWLDHRGALLKSQDPLGNVTLRTFDANGQLMKVADPAGRIRTYNYDAQGNVATETDALGYPTRYSYSGPFNRLSSVLDANGNPTRYNYEPDGDLASIVNAANLAEGWTYDAQGNRRSWQNRRGQTITYTNDSLGRVIARRYPDGTLHTFRYDSRGNLTNYTDATGSTAQQFDAQDRLTQITYPAGYWLRYTYDSAGRRASMTDHLGHRTDYHYGADARLQSLTDETAREIVRYEYDLAGRMSRKTLGNGVYTTYAYDAAGQLLDLFNHQTNSAVLSRFQYTYDSRGRRVTMTTTYGTGDPRTSLAGLWRYDYDDTGQLIGWTAPWGRRVDYRYDGLGNRLLVRDNGTNIAYTVNNLNQYTQVGSTTYQYDGDGNLTNKVAPEGATVFGWSFENKLIVTMNSSGTSQNSYDASGSRVRFSIGARVSEFVMDPAGLGNIVGAYEQGTLVNRYENGSGLVARRAGQQAAGIFVFDGVGNTSDFIGDSSAATNAYACLPFGELVLNAATAENGFQFVGEQGVMSEQRHAHFMRARYYDSEIGRFISEDPIGAQTGPPNLYSYAHNTPTTSADPTGWADDVYGTTYCDGRVARIEMNPKFYGNPLYKCLLAHEVRHASQCREGRWSDNVDCLEVEAYNVSARCMMQLGAPEARDQAQRARDALSKCNRHRDFWRPFPPPFCLLGQLGQGGGGGGGSDECGPPTPTPPTPPIDPNELLGPGGYGAQNFVAAGSLLPYRINFENASNALAPAQFVTVQNVLATNLDLTAFELSSLGFGDRFFAIPSGSQHYERTETLTMSGFKFQVQIEAGLNLATRTVYATFKSINPTNGLPPTVDIGFLPPENGTGRGMGHLAYTIRPRTNLLTGTAIRNIASIVFDQQPAIGTDWVDPHDASKGIDTNKQALVTIDANGPSSSVNPLPASATNATFLVCWSGSDAGSGIVGYDLYVSSNGGPWTLWLANTPSNCVAFSASGSTSYGFYSVARDGAGNVEPAPASPDASTLVVSDTVSLGLSPGYNLVSVPLAGTGLTNAEALARAIPYCRGVWRWDALQQGWSGHLLGGPNNFSVAAGDALLASVTNAGTFTVTGTWTTAPQTVRRGYNLLVLGKTHQTLTTAEALATNIPNCTGVWKWDAAAQGWSGHRTGGPNNFSVSLGRAYLVFATSDGQW